MPFELFVDPTVYTFRLLDFLFIGEFANAGDRRETLALKHLSEFLSDAGESERWHSLFTWLSGSSVPLDTLRESWQHFKRHVLRIDVVFEKRGASRVRTLTTAYLAAHESSALRLTRSIDHSWHSMPEHIRQRFLREPGTSSIGINLGHALTGIARAKAASEGVTLAPSIVMCGFDDEALRKHSFPSISGPCVFIDDPAAVPPDPDTVFIVNSDAVKRWLNERPQILEVSNSLLWFSTTSEALDSDFSHEFAAEIVDGTPQADTLLSRVSLCSSVLRWHALVFDTPAKWFAELPSSPARLPVAALPFGQADIRHLSNCHACQVEAYDRLHERAIERWERMCGSYDDLLDWFFTGQPSHSLPCHFRSCARCRNTIHQLSLAATTILSEQITKRLAEAGMSDLSGCPTSLTAEMAFSQMESMPSSPLEWAAALVASLASDSGPCSFLPVQDYCASRVPAPTDVSVETLTMDVVQQELSVGSDTSSAACSEDGRISMIISVGDDHVAILPTCSDSAVCHQAEVAFNSGLRGTTAFASDSNGVIRLPTRELAAIWQRPPHSVTLTLRGRL